MTGKLRFFYTQHRSTVLKSVIWVGGFVALWVLLAGLVLPLGLRYVAESQLSATLGSSCTLQKVRFNPFTLRLTAENLRIPLPGGDEFFRLEGFEVRLSPAGIYRFAPVLSDLRLIKPHLVMTLREDGRLSFSDLVPASSQTSSTDSGGKSGMPFGVMVTELEIRDGSVLFLDDIRQAEHTIANLGLLVPFTSTLNRHRERPITPYLKAVVNGRPLRVDGRLVPFAEQLHTEFDIQLDALRLAQFQPYLKSFTSATVNDGSLSTNLVFSLRQVPQSGIRLGLAGSLSLADLVVQSPEGVEALRLPRVAVDLNGSLNTPEGLTLKKVEIKSPEAHLALLADGRLDWMTWINRQEGEEPEAAIEPGIETETETGSSLPLHLERLELRDGRVFWKDRKIKGGFEASADKIALTVTGLDLPATAPASLEADLHLNQAGQFSLEGTFLPAPLQGVVRLQLQHLPLTDFQPFLAAAGVPVSLEQGVLSAGGLLETAPGETGLAIFFKEGELSLQGLACKRTDNGKEFFRMERLALTGVAVDTGARRLEAEQLLLDGPDLSLMRDRKGRLDLMQLRPAAASSATTSASKETEPWQVRLAELKLQNGQVFATFQGGRETRTAVLEQLAGSITGFTTAVGQSIGIALSGKEKQGGTLAVDGKGSLEPLNMNLRLRTRRLNLKPFSPLLGQLNPALRLGAGRLSLDLRTGLRKTRGKTAARVGGAVSLTSLSLLEGKREFAALRTLRVRNLDIQSDSQRYSLGEVSLVRPQLKLVVDAAGQTNLARLFGGDAKVSEPKTEAAEKKRAEKGPYLRIGGVNLSEGTVTLRDERYKPAVANQLDQLAVDIDAFDNTPESRARITLSGALNGASISGEGELNPLLAEVAVDLQAQLHTLDLTTLSPMAERFIAYPLRQGAFSLDSKVSIDQGQLDSSHRIELDQLKLGDKIDSPDAPDLPVKLGISLLQDPAGNIDLTLPVRGDLNDPGFSIGGLVFKVISNLLIKAVASPFTFLGSLLGGSGEGLEFIPFDPGDGRLLSANAQAVATIADLLMKRPKINLVLVPQADEQDREQLAEAYVRRRMQEMKYAALSDQERAEVLPQDLPVGPEVDADEYADLLFDIYAEQPFEKPKNFIGMILKLPPQEMMEAIRQHYPSDDSALEQLALERARHLREAFIALHRELESRISVQRPQVPSDGHRVTFGLK